MSSNDTQSKVTKNDGRKKVRIEVDVVDSKMVPSNMENDQTNNELTTYQISTAI